MPGILDKTSKKRGVCIALYHSFPQAAIVKAFFVGWVEERVVVQGCIDYGAEDANPVMAVS